MNNFYVGQKVVCVDDNWIDFNWNYVPNKPTRGQVYTVRAVGEQAAGPQDEITLMLWLCEITNEPRWWRGPRKEEAGFIVTRFRPAVDKPDVVEQFRRMCREAEKALPRTLSPAVHDQSQYHSSETGAGE